MKEFYKNFDHYYDFEGELQDHLKLAKDHRADKGEIERTVNLYHPKKIAYKVSQIQQENDTVKTLCLESVTGYLPPFIAGQFILVNIVNEQTNATKAVYLASSPAQRDHYEITVSANATDPVSKYLYHLKVGDPLTSSGPFGEFTYNNAYQGENLVFVGTQDNTAPIKSIVTDQLERGRDNLNIHMIVITNDEGSALYHNELKTLANTTNINLNFISPNTFTLQALQTLINVPEKYRYFLIGTNDETEAWKTEINKLEIKSNHIRVENPYVSQKDLLHA